MQPHVKGNWEMSGLDNPTIARRKPIYAKLWVPKNGVLVEFRKRVQIRRGGWGHHYWYMAGKKIAPVHMYNGKWVLSTKEV